jgi:hypothetical protein
MRAVKENLFEEASPGENMTVPAGDFIRKVEAARQR